MGWLARQHRKSNLIFGALFLVSLVLFGRIMAPFVTPVLLGVLLVVLFHPLQRAMTRITGRRRALAAGLSTGVVVLVIVVPLSVVTYFVGRELLVMIETARQLLDDPSFHARLEDNLPAVLQRYVADARGAEQLERILVAGMTGSAGVVRDVVGAGTELAIDVFLMTVSMYYFFLDGRRIYSEAARAIPLERRYLDAFAKEFKDVAWAIMYGNTMTAVLQGLLGLVGLVIAGVPQPAVWAMAMVVFAIIPISGTALVWLPLSAALIIGGQQVEGLFLFGWGALVVSTVDNVVRPRLCGRRMTLHPLLVFLSMFGGLAVFGVMGLLIGPLIAAIFMAMVRIYRRDFLRTEATVTADAPVVTGEVPRSAAPST
ncbi:MAG: AI-2E family transporter [Myxococcaceae bacterium]